MADYPRQVDANRWIIEVKGKNGNNEELYIQLPLDALNQMGWAEGDTIEWIKQENGSYEIKKVSNNDR